jgi:Protein of unknown function (DUF732)
MFCPYCGFEVGDADMCPSCGTLQGSNAVTGWRPDPTARHEGRYYTTGRPTDRVRDGKAKSTDPTGGEMLPLYTKLPSSARTTTRSAWLGTGGAVAILVLLALVVWGLLQPGKEPQSPEESYLSSLRDGGLTGQFNSDENALAHGRQVCKQLDDGGPQQGLPADKLAVDAFCPRFNGGFHILETATAAGTFTLTDTSSNEYTKSITSDGKACAGADGYSDVDSQTQIIVRNGKGEILAVTSLGTGKGNEARCTFSFGFPITEGQDRYVVSVGHRGEFSYSFGQLQQGIEIHLGH